VDLDRQAIERRDFPVSRRGYDPAAVDAHLRDLAAEFEQLRRAASGGDTSLASTAGTQVQSIIQAAETAAAEIGSHAQEHARSVRGAADRDAERTRAEAIERARAHNAAVERAAAALLERVHAMDAELGTLLETLRAGAGRLEGDLGALERGMGELYDAAAGRVMAPAEPGAATEANADGEPSRSQAPASAPATRTAGEPPTPEPAAPAPPKPVAPERPAPEQPATAPAPPAARTPEPEQPAGGGDLDGARLVALNMALNGQPREEAERYLAAHFQSIDRVKLIDEVYAAIEG
jgi:DivIVA domain-containing protein